MKISHAPIIAILIGLVFSNPANAAAQWWQQLYAPNSNNQVTLKDANNNNVTAIQNPTAANALVNSNTTSQPATIVLQATATLPVVAIGSACINGKNTAALSASDNLTLLVCGVSNVWQITNRVALPTVVVGAVCNAQTDGNLAIDSTGLPLSCQSGVWAKQAVAGLDKWCGYLTSVAASNALYGNQATYPIFKFAAYASGVGFGKYSGGFFSGTWSGQGYTAYGCYNLPGGTSYSGSCDGVILNAPAALTSC